MTISTPARAAAVAVVALLGTGSVVMALGGSDVSTSASRPSGSASPSDVPDAAAEPRGRTLGDSDPATPGSGDGPVASGGGASDRATTRAQPWTPAPRSTGAPTTGPTAATPAPGPITGTAPTPVPSAAAPTEGSPADPEPSPSPAPDDSAPLLDGLVELLGGLTES